MINKKYIKIFSILLVSTILLVGGFAFTLAQISVSLPTTYQADVNMNLPARQSDDQLFFLCNYDETPQLDGILIYEVSGIQLNPIVDVELLYTTNDGVSCSGRQQMKLSLGPSVTQQQLINGINNAITNAIREEAQSNHRPPRAKVPVSVAHAPGSSGPVTPGEGVGVDI